MLTGSVAILALWAWISASDLRRRTHSLQPGIAAAALEREQQSGVARLFAASSVDTTLVALRQHLPANLRLVGAAGEGGRLTITIEVSDPDALRRIVRAEPWFAGFRERGQAIGRDGSIRVMFEQTA